MHSTSTLPKRQRRSTTLAQVQLLRSALVHWQQRSRKLESALLAISLGHARARLLARRTLELVSALPAASPQADARAVDRAALAMQGMLASGFDPRNGNGRKAGAA